MGWPPVFVNKVVLERDNIKKKTLKRSYPNGAHMNDIIQSLPQWPQRAGINIITVSPTLTSPWVANDYKS